MSPPACHIKILVVEVTADQTVQGDWSLHLQILNLITSAKTLFLNKVTFTLFQGLRHGHYLFGCYYSTHYILLKDTIFFPLILSFTSWSFEEIQEICSFFITLALKTVASHCALLWKIQSTPLFLFFFFFLKFSIPWANEYYTNGEKQPPKFQVSDFHVSPWKQTFAHVVLAIFCFP